jgi:hypothetical protein
VCYSLLAESSKERKILRCFHIVSFPTNHFVYVYLSRPRNNLRQQVVCYILLPCTCVFTRAGNVFFLMRFTAIFPNNKIFFWGDKTIINLLRKKTKDKACEKCIYIAPFCPPKKLQFFFASSGLSENCIYIAPFCPTKNPNMFFVCGGLSENGVYMTIWTPPKKPIFFGP